VVQGRAVHGASDASSGPAPPDASARGPPVWIDSGEAYSGLASVSPQAGNAAATANGIQWAPKCTSVSLSFEKGIRFPFVGKGYAATQYPSTRGPYIAPAEQLSDPSKGPAGTVLCIP